MSNSGAHDQPGARPVRKSAKPEVTGLLVNNAGALFKKGASGRIGALIKGGLAALFVKREIRLASGDVKANPTLVRRSPPH
jgi:hypothetical protein